MNTLPVDESWESTVDGCDVLLSPLPHEIDLGNRLGAEIDTDDDDDAGVPRTLLRTVGDQARALKRAQEMKGIMVEYGVPEVSIELLPGRPNEYGVYDALFTVADMSHHTVSRYSSTSLTPVLALCKVGRSDLSGPLCNGYGGWDLCYRILTFGYANHSGVGGPLTVPALTAGSFTIPQDSGRRYLWGTEWEGGLSEADWDRPLVNPRNGKRMTFREFMGRSNAALEEALKIHKGAHIEHSTWTSRKIDRLGYNAAKGIAEKAPYSKGDWFDMATTEDLKKAVAGTPITIKVNGKEVTWRLERVLRFIANQAQANDSDAMVAAIVAALPTTSGGTLTKAEVEAAVERGVRDVLGSLDA